ncbi:MAP3K12-binding inhibitory protein 1 [Brienomyrus brachyistius]|uniref:MAP3K12-binding inhibitory protein 1 n=1 Tax=Brienomyrus brachyistius TaxID=42636 RepID=UPI0020B40967|nr:MAP3K12-binding inhibitory protein 1 [Brienomyrus brachyistius]
MRSRRAGKEMAEFGEINGEQSGRSEQVRSGGGLSHGEGASALRESVCGILNAMAAFSTELNLGADALKLDVSPSRINISSLQPASVLTCVQQHISKLQTVSANLKQLIEADAVLVAAADSGGDVGPAGGSIEPKRDDPNVQIKVSKSEIDRRISAFIERKQLEINESNVREFCNVINCNQENSCARTDAIFTPFPGLRSHVKVTRVVNTYGPQTRAAGGRETTNQKRGGASRDCGNPAVEERLHNIEAHLKLSAEGPVPLNIYQRLKMLEDRILELEGLSPEYFQSMTYLHKRRKTSSQAYSLTELDGKINALKATLLKKVGEFRLRDAEEFLF